MNATVSVFEKLNRIRYIRKNEQKNKSKERKKNGRSEKKKKKQITDIRTE